MLREAYPFYHNVIPNEIWVFRAEGAKEIWVFLGEGAKWESLPLLHLA